MQLFLLRVTLAFSSLLSTQAVPALGSESPDPKDPYGPQSGLTHQEAADAFVEDFEFPTGVPKAQFWANDLDGAVNGPLREYEVSYLQHADIHKTSLAERLNAAKQAGETLPTELEKLRLVIQSALPKARRLP